MSIFPDNFHPLKQELNLNVINTADKLGLKAYMVGGYIRDAIADRYNKNNLPKDFDYIILNGSAISFAKEFAQLFSGHFVMLDHDLDIARVVMDNGVVLDFAKCLGKNLEEDIMRRDFTINALVWDPANANEVLDLVGGINDLKNRTIKMISADNLKDDPLRILRAFRFSTMFDTTIDEDTLKTIQSMPELLDSIAPERISYELFLIMKSKNASKCIIEMGKVGLLEVIFPELKATRKVPTNAYHHLGLWDHSIETMAQAELEINNMSSEAKVNLEQELSPGITKLDATKIACLLHDIGKPETWEVRDDGRHTFYGHDRLGAKMAEAIGSRLKWSKQVSRFIVDLVQWHLRPGQLFHQGEPTQRAIHRFYRAIDENTPGLMLLAFADLGATCGPGLMGENRDNLKANLIELFAQFFVFKKEELESKQYLDGQDIMRLLNIEPGPKVGAILEALVEAQALGEVNNRAQAEQFAQNFRQGQEEE